MIRSTWIIVCFAIAFVGCGNQQDQITEGNKNVDSIEDNHEQTTGRWVSLKKQADGFVYFVPCDADPREIIISGDSLIDINGHEKIACKLVSQRITKASEITFETEPDCSYGNTFTLAQIDTTRHIQKWSLYNGVEFFSTREAYLHLFPKVKQNCLECYPPEECHLKEDTKKMTEIVEAVKGNTHLQFWEGNYFFEGAESECFVKIQGSFGTIEYMQKFTGFVDSVKVISSSADGITLRYLGNQSGSNFDTRKYEHVTIFNSNNKLKLSSDFLIEELNSGERLSK